jgi:hypothetical protein
MCLAVNYKELVGFERAYTPMRRAHPLFRLMNTGAARYRAPPISASLFLPAKLIIHSYRANTMHKKQLKEEA